MDDGSLMAYGAAVFFTAIVGAYVYMRDPGAAGEERGNDSVRRSSPEDRGKSVTATTAER